MLHFISIAANAVTALAYFWIPFQGFLYLTKVGLRLDQLNRKLSLQVRLFVLFIFCCGVHHAHMAWTIATSNHGYSTLLAVIDSAMVIVSVWAAKETGPMLKEIGKQLSD